MTVNIANISLGTGPDTNTGEPLRTAFGKINNNFANVKGILDTVSGNVVTGNLEFSGQTITGTLSNTDITLDPLGIGEVAVAGNLRTSFLNFRGNSITTQYAGDLVLNASAGNIALADPLKFPDGTIQYSAAVGNASTINTLTVTNLTTGNILPSANVTYSLGSEDYQWKDLWVSNATIYINSVPITLDSTNQIVVGTGNTAANLATQNYVASYTTWANVSGKPTALSQFSNDTNFANTTYVDNRITNLIGGAPAALDTLKEIADSMANNTSLSASLTTLIGTKANANAVVSSFTNDAGYITASTANVISVNGQTGAVTLDLNTYTDSNVADFLSNYTGTINFIASPAIISGVGIITTQTANVTGNVNTSGNVSASYFIGNGSQLTGLPASYTNSNVASLLSSFGSNTLSTTGNVTAGYFIGDGSQLTGLPASYTNSNVTSLLSAFGSNTITTTGNITAGNISGNINITGNITGTSTNVTLVAGAYTTTFDNTGLATFPGNITTSGSVHSTNNGNGTNFKVGDDVWLGDINVANSLSIRGQQDAANGYIIFGNSSNVALGRAGTGPLTYGGAFSATGNISAGNVSSSGTLTATGKIGYASGSTVTQTSNRGNGVNITALAGTIVTVSDTIASGDADYFFVTNPSVDPSTDIVLVQVTSYNPGTYTVVAQPTSTPSAGFLLTISNYTAFASPTESITIRFMVIKSPNA